MKAPDLPRSSTNLSLARGKDGGPPTDSGQRLVGGRWAKSCHRPSPATVACPEARGSLQRCAPQARLDW